MSGILPLSVMERLLKKAGAKRVSGPAKEEMQRFIARQIEEITQRAHDFSVHASRKTLKKEDIVLSIDTKF